MDDVLSLLLRNHDVLGNKKIIVCDRRDAKKSEEKSRLFLNCTVRGVIDVVIIVIRFATFFFSLP
jgi:hypothetical protein